MTWEKEDLSTWYVLKEQETYPSQAASGRLAIQTYNMHGGVGQARQTRDGGDRNADVTSRITLPRGKSPVDRAFRQACLDLDLHAPL